MKKSRIAALAYVVISVVVIAFQIALAAGAPWGGYAMGGAFPLVSSRLNCAWRRLCRL